MMSRELNVSKTSRKMKRSFLSSVFLVIVVLSIHEERTKVNAFVPGTFIRSMIGTSSSETKFFLESAQSYNDNSSSMARKIGFSSLVKLRKNDQRSKVMLLKASSNSGNDRENEIRKKVRMT